MSREPHQGSLRPIGLIPSFLTGSKEIISRESSQEALSLVGSIPINFVTGCKSIISRELVLGALSPIELIPSNLF